MSEDSSHDESAPSACSDVVSAHSDWDYARKYASLIGPPHGLFTNCVRYLRQIEDATPATRINSKHAALYPLNTVMGSPSFRSIIYYAAQALHPTELSEIKQVTPGALISTFTADELSAVVATAYVYRRIRRIIDPKLWTDITGDVHIQMEAGYHICQQIPTLSLKYGLTIGALRHACVALFSKKDEKGYRQHKRLLNKEERLFDLVDEQQRWQCNHRQILSVLLQITGFGIGAPQGIVATSSPTSDTTSGGDRVIRDAQAWFATREWIDSLVERECAPNNLESRFNLDASKLPALQQRIDAIYEKGSSFDWIDKTKEDLPRELEKSLGVDSPTTPSGEEKLPADII